MNYYGGFFFMPSAAGHLGHQFSSISICTTHILCPLNNISSPYANHFKIDTQDQRP